MTTNRHQDNPPAAMPAPAAPATPAQEEFHLAKPGSKDYVAGQPVDEAELAKVTAEDEAKKAAAKAIADKAAAGKAT